MRITLCALSIALFLLGGIMSEAHAAPRIVITIKHTELSLGGTVRVQVRYTNSGTKPLHRREPLRCWETRLVFSPAHHPAREVRLGKRTRVATDFGSRVIVESAKEIDLAPGASYEFTVEVGARWSTLLRPGRGTLRIVDEMYDPPAASTEVAVRVQYDKATPPALLSILRSADASGEDRQHAAEWLDALHPDQALLGALSSPPEALSAALDRYQAWWRQNQDTSQVKQRLDALNAEPPAKKPAPQ